MNQKALINGQEYTLLEILTSLDGGQPLILCEEGNGKRAVCSEPLWCSCSLSLDVKVLTAITDKVGTSFSVEALENCDEKIIAGDIITVTSDYAEVIDALDNFQTADCFTIYFPVVNETSDGLSVNCIDAIPQN